MKEAKFIGRLMPSHPDLQPIIQQSERNSRLLKSATMMKQSSEFPKTKKRTSHLVRFLVQVSTVFVRICARRVPEAGVRWRR